jgi:hypothetical protein
LASSRFLVGTLREHEEDERRAEQDGDDAREVGPLVALQEARLRAAMIWSWTDGGYREAVSAALENDFVSSACVLLVTSFPEDEISVPAVAA